MMVNAAGVNPQDWMQSVSVIVNVHHRGKRPFTLGEAVSELGTWASVAREEAWIHGGNRHSLDEDIAALTKAVGPELLAVLSDLLPDLTTANDRALVARSASDFANRWTRRSSIGAAFRDLCTLAASPGVSSTELEPRARILASQLDETARGSGMLGVVSDLLAAEPDEWRLDLVRKQDGLFVDSSAGSRLAAAERLLTVAPPSGAVVVWSLYRRARVPWRTSAGPITFFRAADAIHLAMANEGNTFPEQDELRALLQSPFGLDADRIMEHEKLGESHVLVRAELGARIPLGADEEAERHTDALLNIAAGAGGVSWVYTGTSVTLLDGEPVRSSFGANYERQEPFSDSYGIGATSELVETWSTRLEASMSKGPMPGPLMEALASVKEARLTDHRDVHFYDTRPVTPRVATALEDHALEQISTLAQLKPEPLMNELMFQEAARVWDKWVVSAIAAPLDRRGEIAEQRQKREAVERKICQHNQYGYRLVDLDKAWEARDELRELAEVSSVREELNAALRAISDPAQETRSRARMRAETQLVRNRHRRVRNAVAHGNPVSPAALDSVRDYSDSVTGDALSLALQSYATSRDISDIISDRRTARANDDPRYGSLLDRMAAAAATASVPSGPIASS